MHSLLRNFGISWKPLSPEPKIAALIVGFPCNETTLWKTAEHFYSKLQKLAENCDFKNKEETLIRDVFITNLNDPEIQKKDIIHSVEPRQALELANNMKLGMQNQHQMQQHNKTLIQASVIAIQSPNNPR